MGVLVTDTFNVTQDPKMPFLVHCLNPRVMQEYLQSHIQHTGLANRFHLSAIHVFRYKAGRRCMIEYCFDIVGHGGKLESRTIIGKVNAKGLDTRTVDLQRTLWRNGFDSRSEDGISVPQPLGVIEEFNMWLQEKVPGVPATRLLADPSGAEIAARVANAIAKLHWANVPAKRRHTIEIEIRILRERMEPVKNTHPSLASRIESVMDASEELATTVGWTTPSGIHRDFYADQVIVDGNRLYIIDLDSYCEGDPALDVGNFLAHITELSVRMFGHPNTLSHVENSLRARFLLLVGGKKRHAVEVYTTLTLARHIFLSTQFPGRRQTTEQLLELCEQRLGIGSCFLFPIEHRAISARV